MHSIIKGKKKKEGKNNIECKTLAHFEDSIVLTSTEYMFVWPAVSFSTYPVQPRLRGGNVPETFVFSPANHSTLTFPTYSCHKKNISVYLFRYYFLSSLMQLILYIVLLINLAITLKTNYT